MLAMCVPMACSDTNPDHMQSTATLSVSNDALLTHVPMIMSHDAASGYLGTGVVNRWTKTQNGSFADQLNCGARAFDARPLYKDNKLIWHHGNIDIDHEFAESINEIIGWLNGTSQLALLLISDCSGTGCDTAVDAALKSANVSVVSDCSDLATLTYSKAKEFGSLPAGGSLLAVTGGGGSNGAGCSIGNYDPSIVCSAFTAAKNSKTSIESKTKPFYGCWASDSTKSRPLNDMMTYLDKVSAGGLSNTYFTQFQALWQEGTDSVVIGTLRDSSLLQDEQKSGINYLNAKYIAEGRWKNISLFEVNNVCDGGPQLMAALQKQQFL